MPVLRTKKALEVMKSGQTLEVTVDYPPSKENVQRFAVSQGNEVLGIEEEGNITKIFAKENLRSRNDKKTKPILLKTE